jgi:hypothetical protein
MSADDESAFPQFSVGFLEWSFALCGVMSRRGELRIGSVALA